MAYTKEFQAELQRFRGQHDDGLAWDLIRVQGERKGQERLRSKADSRLFDAMDPDQLRAYLAIGSAFRTLTAGLGATTLRYGAAQPAAATGSEDPEWLPGLLLRYGDWRTACKRDRLDADMAVDVIAGGHTLRSAALQRRKCLRSVRKQLFAALDLWNAV